MIEYKRFQLTNGLKVLVHEDPTTPMAVVNVMYDVGARDEDPTKTGFAHLFEHLMFGGSINIDDFDGALQMAGGDNNAYTTNDLTNYYISIPAENLETALWLESDRMLSLDFNDQSLEVQRKVVCEEFKEHYINKPYGDVWFKMRQMAYQQHPYQWMTIGKELSHIENATLFDVKNFFYKHYTPCNAVLVIAGNVKYNNVEKLVKKWFEDIPSGTKYNRQLPIELDQTSPRFEKVNASVPVDALYKTWHIDERQSHGYYVADLITEVLGGGSSSRMFQQLVKEKRLFSSIDCYQMGSIDKGLLAFEGKLVKGVSIEEGDKAVQEIITELCENGISDRELTKIQHKTESSLAFEDMSVLTRANNLAFYELLGEAELFNQDRAKYFAVTANDIKEYSQKIFAPDQSNTLYYLGEN